MVASLIDRLDYTVYLLFHRRLRQTLRGLELLRHAYEHVFILAAQEDTRAGDKTYYQAYVDALEILGSKSLLVAGSL